MISNVKQHTPLILRREIKRPKAYTCFRLAEPFEFSYSKKGEPRRNVTIPEGYESDLASVPRVVRSIVSKVDLVEASVAHDWLCESKIVPRKEADEVYLAFAVQAKDPWVTRNIAYLAVRIYGELHK